MNKQDEKLTHVRKGCFCKWACKFCQTACELSKESRSAHQHWNDPEIINAKIPAANNAQDIQERKCSPEYCWECNDVLC